MRSYPARVQCYEIHNRLPLEGKLSAQLTDEVESSESDETASSDTDEVEKCMI